MTNNNDNDSLLFIPLTKNFRYKMNSSHNNSQQQPNNNVNGSNIPISTTIAPTKLRQIGNCQICKEDKPLYKQTWCACCRMLFQRFLKGDAKLKPNEHSHDECYDK